jgi:hypothetical protein
MNDQIGPREHEAFGWLADAVAAHQAQRDRTPHPQRPA